jgi:hypothetical protein
VQEEHSMRFYTLHQSQQQRDQESIKKSEVFVTKLVSLSNFIPVEVYNEEKKNHKILKYFY